MLYSVQKYVQNQLTGLAMPTGIPGPLVARITPPTVEKMDAPRAHVWGGRVRASRQTAPRGVGFKQFPWVVDVYLVYLDMPADAMENEPFAQIIDVVLKQFMTATMPVWIDAQGNVITPAQGSPTDTQIQAIGETFDLDYPPEKLAQSQRMVWYSARIGLEVLEVVQA